jgi:glycosyltransferase involved in cell wall biosynthesis
MKRLVIIASKRSGFPTSWVGKYILAYVPFFQSSGYIVEYLFQPEKHGLIDGYLWRLFILPRILRKEYRDDIKIFYDESFLTSLRRWMKKTSIVIVHHTYGIETSGLLDKVFKVIWYIGFHFFLRHTSSIITVSHETKKVLEQSNYRKNIPIVCIPNSVSKPEFNPLESLEYLDLPSNKKIILFVASTETRKNVPTAIQVLSQLPEEYILVRVWKMSIWNQQTIIRRMI